MRPALSQVLARALQSSAPPQLTAEIVELIGSVMRCPSCTNRRTCAAAAAALLPLLQPDDPAAATPAVRPARRRDACAGARSAARPLRARLTAGPPSRPGRATPTPSHTPHPPQRIPHTRARRLTARAAAQLRDAAAEGIRAAVLRAPEELASLFPRVYGARLHRTQ